MDRAMTVAELIAELKKIPNQNMRIEAVQEEPRYHLCSASPVIGIEYNDKLGQIVMRLHPLSKQWLDQ